MHAKIVGYFQFWQCWQETSEEDCSVIPKTSKRREGQKHKAVKTDSVETTKRFVFANVHLFQKTVHSFQISE